VSRLMFAWQHRGNSEYSEGLGVLNLIFISHLIYFYNVLGHTPHGFLLFLQFACLGGLGFFCSKLYKSKEAGAVIQNSFDGVQGSWCSTQNDSIFGGIRMCPTAKLAMPLRAVYSEQSGNLVRGFYTHCSLLGVDICIENRRMFLAGLSCIAVDVFIAVYVACNMIAYSSPSAPSILLPHLFIWYGLWEPGYALLTLLAVYSLYMLLVAVTTIQKQVMTIIGGQTTHEEQQWSQYTYLQDPAGKHKNPFDLGLQTNVLNFLQGKKVPEGDLYTIMELKPKPWRHPKDKRAH